MMVSQHFWPHLLGEDMRLHPAMQKRLEDFSKAYSVVKNPRLLVWKKQVRSTKYYYCMNEYVPFWGTFCILCGQRGVLVLGGEEPPSARVEMEEAGAEYKVLLYE